MLLDDSIEEAGTEFPLYMRAVPAGFTRFSGSDSIEFPIDVLEIDPDVVHRPTLLRVAGLQAALHIAQAASLCWTACPGRRKANFRTTL